MSTWDLLEQKRGDFGPWLRRSFWLPLRRWLQMFHVLPVIAALVLFGLLAGDGQLREIYVSYLEDVGSGGLVTTALRFFAAAFGFGLISAVIYEAHYLLSRAHRDVIYAMNIDPDTGSNVQDAAGVVLAMAPWLGLVAGLFYAKFYLAGLFKLLQTEQAPKFWTMQHVPMPSVLAIAVGIIVLGLVLSFLVAGNRRSPTLQRSIIVLTPPSAALLFLLLTDPPQFNPGPLDVTLIALAVSALVAVYYFVYTVIRAMRPHVFSRALQEKTGINLRSYQPIFLFLLTLMPWVATIVGYLIFAPGPPKPDELHGWAMIAVAISWTVSIGLGVVFLLYRFRRTPALKWSIYGMVLVLALLGLSMAWASTDWIVTVYRLVGPLGSLAFAVLFLISIFVLLAALSQRSGFPALTMVILALVGSVALPKVGVTVGVLAALCLVIFAMAMVSKLWSVAAVAVIIAITGATNFVKLRGLEPVALQQSALGNSVDQQFETWLSNRLAENHAGSTGQAACTGNFQQYPVYIFAATGGGIYAASAASMLLARLQDQAPCFAEHVFAISAVSGGAIGATIFEALAQSKVAPPPPSAAAGKSVAPNPVRLVPGCLPPQYKDEQPAEQKRDLEDEVTAILEGDHFSPLVASIFPELLGFTHTGRAPELAASFEHSVNTVDRGAAQTLCQPFAQQWSTASNVPALVLNATWVETGYRAAFAPFPLHAIDDSLYSFDDKCMPDVDPNNPNAPSDIVTTIGAALVSARFPIILPPYSVQIKKPGLPDPKKGECPDNQKGSSERTRWNFVDGGYSDTTGATTALALYQALNPIAVHHNIKLRVILLTSSDPRLSPSNINGTVFADTLAPINAMLSVRDGLGNEAVARACNGIVNPASSAGGQNPCEVDLSNDQNSPLQIVGIDDATYGLSLGWKISQTTFSVVSWMLGEPQLAKEAMCQAPTAESANPTPQSNGQFTRNNKVVCANSRVLNTVLSSFGYMSPAQ